MQKVKTGRALILKRLRELVRSSSTLAIFLHTQISYQALGFKGADFLQTKFHTNDNLLLPKRVTDINRQESSVTANRWQAFL